MKLKRISRKLLLFGTAVCFVCAAQATTEAPVLAPGWGELGYELPKPGTYELPVIRQAAGGKVLKADGSAADLNDFLGGKITVLSFIYTSCNDINGCPLSIFVMHQLQDRLKQEPEIAEHLRLVSLSFDIKNDTPEVLRTFQQEHGDHANHDEHAGHGGGKGGDANADKAAVGKGADWFFVVSASERELKPLLKEYSQFVIPEINKDSDKTGKFSHLLRVFLIDKRGRIRNIYSPDFLHPEILLADTKNLLFTDGHGDGRS